MCRRKGFKRIGLALSTESDSRSNRLWFPGYLGMQQMLPKSERVNPLLTPTEPWHAGKIERWILKEKPDVILIHALGCFPGVETVLEKIPFKVSHVVLDREPDDPCAGIDQQFNISARLLVDLLSAQILHNQRGIPQTPIVSMVDGTWIDHPSLSPITGKRGYSEVALK
jgi:LacI family transcriptional regulator